LYNYLKLADDKKVKAIYTILENDIIEQMEWWNDDSLLEDLEKEYAAWENGNSKAYTLEEIEQSVAQLKNKRQTSWAIL